MTVTEAAETQIHGVQTHLEAVAEHDLGQHGTEDPWVGKAIVVQQGEELGLGRMCRVGRAIAHRRTRALPEVERQRPADIAPHEVPEAVEDRTAGVDLDGGQDVWSADPDDVGTRVDRGVRQAAEVRHRAGGVAVAFVRVDANTATSACCRPWRTARIAAATSSSTGS